MNTVTLKPDHLVVEPTGLDKVWSFTRALQIPLAHVRGATADPGANDEPKGVRAPGLSVPGKTAGTFYRDGEKIFYNISRPRDTIVIELADEEYHRLVPTVDDPRRLVQAIHNAIGSAGT